MDRNIKNALSSFTWKDITFEEGDIEIDNCERIHVIIKGVQMPTNIINLRAQQTRLGKIQLHIFLDESVRGNGVATKIYIAFIHEFGSVYSGFGRVMNERAILSIYKNLSKEADISVNYVTNLNQEVIGIEASLKNNN
jgi:hypothetical protein